MGVVIYRLPAVSIAQIRPNAMLRFSYLAWPLSFCPRCGAGIKPWHNIPFVSYILLRGKSSCCKKPISARYFLIELLAALAAMVCLARFGLGFQFVMACIFSWLLLAICWIDAQRYVLPDILVYPLLWLGLVANANGAFVSLDQAVIASVASYLVLFAVSEASLAILGRRMLGSGDPKFIAAIGAWVGWLVFPALFIGAISASVIGIAMQMIKNGGRVRMRAALAFGPHLGFGGFFVMMFGWWLADLYGML